MQRIRKTIEIKAQAQRVFDFITQPTNLPAVWPNLVEVSNVVTKPGGYHEFDWVYKMAGLHFKGHAKTEEAVPGKLSRVRNEGAIPSTFIWTFQGLDGSGTRLTCEVEYTIPVPVLGKLAENLVMKMNEREAETLLQNMKDTLESTTAVAAAAHARP